MKPSSLFLLSLAVLAVSSCSNNNNKPTSATPQAKAPVPDSIKMLCQIPDIEHRVARTDTVRKPNKPSYTVNWYDSKDRVVKQFYLRVPETGSTKTSSSTVVYDTAGHVLYQSIVDQGIQFQCYLYTYHSDGSLASKEGYGSGQAGIREQYPKKDGTIK